MLRLNKGIRDAAEVDGYAILCLFLGIILKRGVNFGDLRRRGRFHLAMIEAAPEDRSQLRPSPVGRCLAYQEMEKRVVSSGNGPSEAGLMWATGMQVCKMLCKFEQIVVKRHSSDHRRLIEFGLLGLASEVEVGEHAPFFERLDLLVDRL